MKTVHIMMGVPGCGKSTLVKTLQNQMGGVVLSGDEIRNELFMKHIMPSRDDQSFNKEVFKVHDSRFETLVKQGETIFLDNLNLEKKYRKFYITLAKQNGYRVVGELLLLDTDECVRRIKLREQNNANTHHITNPQRVVRMWQQQLLKEFPTLQEGFDQINTYQDGKLVKIDEKQ